MTPRQHCSWCGASLPGERMVLCAQCDATPWPRGPRFVLRKIWREDDERGNFHLAIIDRAVCHRVLLPYAGAWHRSEVSRKRRVLCHRLNRETRLQQLLSGCA